MDPVGKEKSWALEGFLLRLDELARVLGPGSEAGIAQAKAAVLEALAARSRGDDAACELGLARAMASVAALGDGLDPGEGALMRALAGAFVQGMAKEDGEAMQTSLDRIEARAGKPKSRP